MSSATENDSSDIDQIPESSSPETTEDPGQNLGEYADIIDGDAADGETHDSNGNVRLVPYMSKCFLEYAISVVKARALPDVGDGQKPVQRRILHIMNEMGLSHISKHVKSARVVGDVMGKLHPHGDSSIYDAMVLSAQDFSRRYPLVDGQGNFGSRDGDGAAAMRYTEARLTKYANLLLSEMKMGTVDFVPNYDGTLTEPRVLPSRLPMVLLNGGSGPAVGYSCDIPSHNLREVGLATQLLIKNPAASLDEIIAIMPAPDFPGGAQIISQPSVMRDIYASGNGGIRMRARWKREELARGQWRIVFYELPHGVSTKKVMEQIEALINPVAPKGKKEISQDQKIAKSLFSSLVDTIRDESSKEHPVYLVVEPKTSKISEDDLIAALLGHTDLECSISINMVMIGLDGNPMLKGLKDIILEWIDFRFITVERRTRHRLDQVSRRIHILEGRKTAFIHLDAVIKTIRESDEPKDSLIGNFGMSEIQAEDVLEIRLRQLARLEGIKIDKEHAELVDESAYLQNLLSNKDAMKALVLKEVESDTKEYADDRRTLVLAVGAVRISASVQVVDEPVTILVSKAGWLRSRPGHNIDPSSLTWKQSDSELCILEMRSTQSLILIDSLGRVYAIAASAIPGGRGDGSPISSFLTIQSGATVQHFLGGAPGDSYLFSNDAGYGYITNLGTLDTNQKAGKIFMTLEPGEKILTPIKVSDANDWVVVSSKGPKESRMLLFPVSEVKVMPKGRGVILMGMDTEEKLSTINMVKGPAPTSVTVTTDAGQTLVINENFGRFLLHRARKGCQLSKKNFATHIE